MVGIPAGQEDKVFDMFYIRPIIPGILVQE
jgi:hypothetical protein